MKTEKLDSSEAYKMMIDGFKIGHPSWDGRTYASIDFSDFMQLSFTDTQTGLGSIAARLPWNDGYFIYNDKPVIQKVTMYRSLLQDEEGHVCVLGAFRTREDAMRLEMENYKTIGCIEVQAWLKEVQNGKV